MIVVSLLGILYCVYPIIMAYLSPTLLKTGQVDEQKGFYIVIPKIHAEAAVIPNVDPWNKAVYLPALRQGVAQAKGTAFPGQQGTIFLFAHSSGAPWEVNWYNTIFMRLGELKNGDEIILWKDGGKYVYKVREKKEVRPNEVSYLLNTQRTQLIVQTCTPIGTTLRRLLVFLDFVGK